MKRLLLVGTILLTLVACSSSLPPANEKPKVVVVPKANFETVEKTDLSILHIDMREKVSVLDMIRRIKAPIPAPFDSDRLKRRAIKGCAIRETKLRKNKRNGWPDVNIIVYGQHPTNSSSYLCLPDKLTKFQMKGYCERMDAELYKFDAINNHVFSCKLNRR